MVAAELTEQALADAGVAAGGAKRVACGSEAVALRAVRCLGTRDGVIVDPLNYAPDEWAVVDA